MELTNVLGVALTARAVLPELVKARGHLLITGSVASHIAPANQLYPATKRAVLGVSESIRKAITPPGMCVTLVSLGRMEAPFWGARPTDFATLSAEEVADAVMFAVTRPASVDVNEVLVRPVGQEV